MAPRPSASSSAPRGPGRRRPGSPAARRGRRRPRAAGPASSRPARRRVIPSLSSAAATRSTSKPSWSDRGGPVDHRAHHDREPGDVAERQAAEPAVVGLDADVEGGADRAPEVVAVGEADRLAAAPVLPLVRIRQWTSSMSCSPSSGRSASVWVSSPGVAEVDGRALGGEDRLAARPRCSRGLSGSTHGARASSARGPGRPARGPGASSARRSRRAARRGRPAAARPRSPRPPARRRSTSTPSATSAVRSGQLWARWASQLSSFTALSWLNGGYRCHASCRYATRTPRPRRSSTRRSSGERGGEYGDILYEKGDGIAKITINRPEVRNAFRPQTLAELRDAFAPRPRRPRGRRRSSSPAPASEAFCSGGDQRIRGDDGYIGDDEVAQQGVGRLDVGDLHVQIRRLPKPVVAMVAGYAVGGGHILHLVCDLTIAADNARFGQTGPAGRQLRRRLRRQPAGAQHRRQAGQGGLVPLPPLRRRARRCEMGLVNAVVPLGRPGARDGRLVPGDDRTSRPSRCAC